MRTPDLTFTVRTIRQRNGLAEGAVRNVQMSFAEIVAKIDADDFKPFMAGRSGIIRLPEPGLRDCCWIVAAHNSNTDAA